MTNIGGNFKKIYNLIKTWGLIFLREFYGLSSKLIQEHKDEVGMSWEHEQEAAANKRVDIDNGGVIMMKRKLQ